MLTGLESFLSGEGRRYRRERLGLIAHGASVTSHMEPAADALARKGYSISTLFAPEHGMDGALQDQVAVSPSRHRRLGVPVHSLYGDPTKPGEFARLSPNEESLRDVDVLLFDLQDVGVRYYTFVWTMALAMASCSRLKKPLVVLDRPNPLGGNSLEGNLPDPGFLSFVGLHPVPVRHGLTAGELARYLNSERGIGADLTVIPMKGWRRRMWFDETGLPWVMPSPNMPTLDTAAVYAGMCLLEGTNLSEGRGTTRPFELAGAPYIDGHALADAMARKRLPGVVFRPCVFTPAFHKWAGRPCGGVQTHVVDRDRFPSFRAGLELIAAVRRLWPEEFSWKEPPYEYVSDRLPFDLLCGGEGVRKALEKGGDVGRLEPSWRADRRRFRTATIRSFLYTENR